MKWFFQLLLIGIILQIIVIGDYIGIKTFIELIDAELIHITLIQVGKLFYGVCSICFTIGFIGAILKDLKL